MCVGGITVDSGLRWNERATLDTALGSWSCPSPSSGAGGASSLAIFMKRSAVLSASGVATAESGGVI